MFNEKDKAGVLFEGREASAAPELRPAQNNTSTTTPATKASSSRVAFGGLFLFTMMLYVRPNDLVPGAFETFQIVKIVAIFTILAYLGSQLSRGNRLTIWPLEMKMLAVMILLAVAFTPLAVSPQTSIETLSDSFFKVVTIFVLMINLIDTRARLRSFMKLLICCGVFVGASAVLNYFRGATGFNQAGELVRIAGYGTFFSNPNELAMAVNLIMPFAVVFGLTSRKLKRLGFFLIAGLLAFAVIVSFSRGGFLGLIAIGGVLMWKAGRGRRFVTVCAGVVIAGAFVVSMPSGYGDRIFTILHTNEDRTHSAQERQELLTRGLDVIAHHPIIGVGAGNYGIYSLRNLVAHNSYVEVAAELGLAGFAAYLVLLLAPLRSLRRIERDTYARRATWTETERETYYISVGLQAVIISYAVCSFFQSAEYSWYLYYLVAYTASLRRIHADEAASGANLVPAPKKSTDGALWSSARGA
ncbi:MAG TPA: O-antigen ligase family protein [Blastocatellia bacterium]|nr:O-antigen ligase family protein [Blastocatellia bacterium]